MASIQGLISWPDVGTYVRAYTVTTQLRNPYIESVCITKGGRLTSKEIPCTLERACPPQVRWCAFPSADAAAQDSTG
jgi:hypothetical protein